MEQLQVERIVFLGRIFSGKKGQVLKMHRGLSQIRISSAWLGNFITGAIYNLINF
jgi:hypothetical protein